MRLYTPKSDRVNWVYIMTNRWNTTFYIGSTSDIIRRVEEHKAAEIKGFTKTYNLNRLVWFEIADNMDTALLREARIKRWRRGWKIELIGNMNPEWRDLYEDAKIAMACASDY